MTDTPPERDLKDFKFKQLAKIRVQPAPENPLGGRVKHIAVANRFGLIFVAVHNGFKVLKTHDLVQKGISLGKSTNQTIEDFDFWTCVDLQQCPQALDVSCDSLTLSVCVKKSNNSFALMYDVRSFTNKNSVPTPFLEARVSSSSNCDVLDTAWNPGAEYASLYAVCTSDGSLRLLNITDSLSVTAPLPESEGITCVCWSPKGKQLVAGKKDGSLTQYDQKLVAKKQIPGPSNLFNFQPVKVIDVLWESTFVFFASYTPVNNTTHEQPHLVHIVYPKGGSPQYRDLEDVCYGGGEDREQKVYMNMLAEWKMIVAASATSLESSSMGKSPEVEGVWEKWILDDAGRAELPLTDDYKETWPMGMAVECTSQQQIPIGDNLFQPASPILLLVATDGVLSSYHMINTIAGLPSLQRAAEAMSEQGARKGKVSPTRPPLGETQPTTNIQPPSTGVAKTLFQSPATVTGVEAKGGVPNVGLFGQTVPSNATLTGIQAIGGGTPNTGLFGQTVPPNTTLTGVEGKEGGAPNVGLFGQTVPSSGASSGLFGQSSTASPKPTNFAAKTLFQSPAQPGVTQPKQEQLVGVEAKGDGVKTGLFGQAVPPSGGGIGLIGQTSGDTTKPLNFGGVTSGGGGFSFGGGFSGSTATATPGFGLGKPIAESTPAPATTSQQTNTAANNLFKLSATSQQGNQAEPAKHPETTAVSNINNPVSSLTSSATAPNAGFSFSSTDSKQAPSGFSFSAPPNSTIASGVPAVEAKTEAKVSFSFGSTGGSSQTTGYAMPIPSKMAPVTEVGIKSSQPQPNFSFSSQQQTPQQQPSGLPTAPKQGNKGFSFGSQPPATQLATNVPSLGPSFGGSQTSIGQTSIGQTSIGQTSISQTSVSQPGPRFQAPVTQEATASTPPGGKTAALSRPVNIQQTMPTQTAKQATISTSAASKRTSDSTQQPQVSQVASPAPVSQTASVQPTTTRQVVHARRKSHETEDPFMKTIMEEMEHFQKELNDLRKRSSASSFEQVGTREEIAEMHKNTKELTTFCNEIKKETQGINGEIHGLKAECLETFATIEECRAREERNHDPTYRHLLASRNLDPISERKLKEIRTQFHYTENGIRDVDLKLDMEWEEYQRKKKGGITLKAPASDAIYRTIVNNKRVIDQHTNRLEKICSELRGLQLYNSTAWDARNVRSPASNRTLEDSINMGKGGHEDYQPRTLGSVKRPSSSFMQNRSLSHGAENIYNSTISPQKAAGSPISPEKQVKLRDVLGNRRITPVKATAPANLSVSRFVTPDRLQEMNESAFQGGSPGLEESYLDNRPTAISKTKPKSPVKTEFTKQGFPSSLSTLLGQSSKPTAFAAVSKAGSPQSSPIVDKKTGVSRKNEDSVFKSGGIGGASTGFSFGGASSNPSQNFSFMATGTPMQTAAKTTTVTLTTQKPVAMTTGISSTAMPKATTVSGSQPFGFNTSTSSSFSFGQTSKPSEISFGQTKPTDVAKQSVPVSSQPSRPSSTFTFSPAPKTDKPSSQGFSFTPMTAKQPVEVSSSTKPPSSAGFSFNTTKPPSSQGDAGSTTGFSFNLSGGVDQNKTKSTAGFTFGDSNTTTSTADDKSKMTTGSFTAFSGSGFKLGGNQATNEQNVPLQQEPQQATNLPSPNTARTEVARALIGEMSQPQSLQSGDFTIGSALASVLVEETSDSLPQRTTESQINQQQSVNSGDKTAEKVSKVIMQPSDAPPNTAVSGLDLTKNKETTPQQPQQAGDAKQTRTSLFGTPSSSKTGGGGFLFGNASGSVFGGGQQSGMGQMSSGFTFGQTDTTAKSTITQEDFKPQKEPPKFGVKVIPTAAPDSSGGGGNENSGGGNGISGGGNGKQPWTAARVGAGVEQVKGHPGGDAKIPVSTNQFSASTSEATVLKNLLAVTTTQPGVQTTSTVVTDNTNTASIALTTQTTTTTTVAGSLLNTALFGSSTAVAATATAGVVSASATTSITTPVTATQAVPGFNFGTATTVVSSTATPVVTSGVSTVPSVFGGQQPATGVNVTTTTAGGQLFGNVTPTATTGTTATADQTPLAFGTTPSTAAQSTGLFGAAPNTVATSVGGQALFGQSTTTSTATAAAPLFGQPGSTTAPSGGFFADTTSSSTGGGLFGSATPSAPGGFFVKRTPITTSSTGFSQPSTFGGQSTSTSGAGGFNAPSFGQQSTFGQPSTTSTTGGFGAPSSFGQTSAFGQAQPEQQASGMFGSSGGGNGLFGGLGGKPSAENANKNVFGTGFTGSAQQPEQTQNLFGSQSTSAFNSVKTTAAAATPGFGSTGGGGTFTAGPGSGGFSAGGGVSATGFGGFTQQTPQKTGFGGAPSFGGSPGFGSPPAFGGQPTFGSSTFGSGGTTMGGAGTTPGGAGGGGLFGGGANQNQAGFASFANTDAPTFGNLAQGGGGGAGAGAAPTFGGFAQQQQPMFGGGVNTPGGFGGFGGGGSTGFGQAANPTTSPSFSSYRS